MSRDQATYTVEYCPQDVCAAFDGDYKPMNPGCLLRKVSIEVDATSPWEARDIATTFIPTDGRRNWLANVTRHKTAWSMDTVDAMHD
jgi:hypothetical protein